MLLVQKLQGISRSENIARKSGKATSMTKSYDLRAKCEAAKQTFICCDCEINPVDVLAVLDERDALKKELEHYRGIAAGFHPESQCIRNNCQLCKLIYPERFSSNED